MIPFEHRFAEALRKILGLRESTALDVLPDIMPVLPCLDADDPAQALPRGERLFTGGALGTAAGAQFPVVWLENNTANTLVVLTEMLVWTNTVQVFNWKSTVNALPGAPALVALDDDRLLGNIGATSRVVFESAVAAITSTRTVVLPIGVQRIKLQQVLRPGINFHAGGTTAATQLAVQFYGYERPVGQAELRF